MTESNSLEFDHFLSQEYNSDEETITIHSMKYVVLQMILL